MSDENKLNLAELSTSQLAMRYNYYRHQRSVAAERCSRCRSSYQPKRDWAAADEKLKAIAAELRTRGIDPEQ
nr:hypothetical protein [uncultured Porphyromonas sp.]